MADKYRVKYYDAKLSKKGRGVQVAVFDTILDAEEFASRNQIYSRPCVVEVYPWPRVQPAPSESAVQIPHVSELRSEAELNARAESETQQENEAQYHADMSRGGGEL